MLLASSQERPFKAELFVPMKVLETHASYAEAVIPSFHLFLFLRVGRWRRPKFVRAWQVVGGLQGRPPGMCGRMRGLKGQR